MKKSNPKKKSLEDYAFQAWLSLNAYRHEVWIEFFHNSDPLDPNYPTMLAKYYETNDTISAIMHHLDEHPNPFDNVL